MKITKTTDEDGHESYEFKNLSDRVILRRAMLSEKESSDTYYIYDYRGNLSFVLPPNYQEEASLDKYAYQYKYDGRGNCIWKKQPGCEPIYMRYTRNNRLAFLQDGNLRKQGDWELYVYDKLGRMVVSGITSSVGDVSETYVYAQYTGTGSLDGYEVVGATIKPKSLLVTNFYDDYSFFAYAEPTLQQGLHLDMANSLESAFPSNASPNARGYQTGKKVYLTDGSGRYVITSQYYGRKGRLVQDHTSNLLGDWEHHYTSYTYAGLPIKSVHVHTANGKRTIQENYSYDYDHVGRLVKTTYGINGSPDKVLSSLDYDDLGRVFTQTLFGKESVAYLYNIRNRKTDIIGQNFNQSLAYNHSNGSLIPRKSLYNGNMVSDKNKGIGSISYDINNQPREISFSDGRKSSYVYDSEGRKHSVSYNLTAMTSAQPLIPVMQSANVVSGNTTNGLKNIQYCDNIIYDDGETIVLNDIGYAKYDRQGNLSFHYYLQDHLGNNRVVMNEDGTIEQVNDYYPTGALMGSSQNGEVQRYKYNGKELDRLNGLDWYDYGARNYDGALVRWNGTDELSEKYYPYSVYVYCKNYFLNAKDVDGRRIVVWYKDRNGNDKSFIFDGSKTKVPSSQFVRDFVSAYFYNVGNGGGLAMKEAAKSNYDYNLMSSESEGVDATMYHNEGGKNKTIFWESRKGLLLSNGKRQSAATRLEHEFDHYVDDVKNHKKHSDRAEETDDKYKNKEERRVITGNEALTVRKNGEGIRYDHKGITFNAKNSISIY